MSASGPALQSSPVQRIEGIVPIIPTPFDPQTEAVDYAVLSRLVEFAAGRDFGAICLPAYASEFYKLDEDERSRVVETAIAAAAGRVPVVAQSNHPAARVAADIARRNADCGADLISFAIPRQFALTDDDLFGYCGTIMGAVTVPVLIQDFNPGGPSMSPALCARLHKAHQNFHYVKLEEPLLGHKIAAMREATQDQVGVLIGWGGMYLMELLAEGICGLMPGLSKADLQARIWRLAQAGQLDQAQDIYEVILPLVVLSLQNLELSHQLEKRLLVARGVLDYATVRQPTYTPRPQVLEYADRLNRRVLALLDTLGLPAA